MTTVVGLVNPYLTEFHHFVVYRHWRSWEGWEVRTDWTPDDGFQGAKFRNAMEDVKRTTRARDQLSRYYAYAVPDGQAIEAIKGLNRPVVEMGAGGGYWAWLLRQAGVEVVAFDVYDRLNPWCMRYWTDVQKGTPESLQQYPDHALLLCWPVFDDEVARSCLDFYPGDTLIYIGQEQGRNKDDDSFFAWLRFAWRVRRHVAIPSWPGLQDQMWVYDRALH